MYVKLFGRMLSSSIMDEDVATRWSFVFMLLAADKTGMVYGTRGALARSANQPLAEFEAALERLLAPDLNSTTPDNDGRRIVMESPNCWRVVNYAHYRDIKDETALREATRARVKECRDRKKAKETALRGGCNKFVTKVLQPVTVTLGNKMKQNVTPSEAATDAATEADLGISPPTESHPVTAGAEPGVAAVFELKDEQVSPKSEKAKRGEVAIPYLELVEEWNDVAAQAGAVFCTVLAKSWRGNMRARWLEALKAGKDPRSMFRLQFETIAASPFCTGRVEGRNGHPPFRAGLDWLVKADSWAKVANGNYAAQESSSSDAEDMARALNVFDEATGGLKKTGGKS